MALILSLSACTFEDDHNKIENWHRLRATGAVSLDKKDYVAAEKSFKDALGIADSLSSPLNRQAVSLEDLSKVCLATGDSDLAASVIAQALNLANKRSQAPKKQMDILESSLGQCLNNLGNVFVRTKKYDEAAIAYREARAIFVDLYRRSPLTVSDLIIGSLLSESIDNLGISYKELGQLKEARQAYLSVAEDDIIKALPFSLKEKLLEDYCQVPDTSRIDKEHYAAMLGCMLPKTAASMQ